MGTAARTVLGRRGTGLADPGDTAEQQTTRDRSADRRDPHSRPVHFALFRR